MNLNDYPELIKAAPATFGSVLSMLWMRETWVRRLVLFFGGATFGTFGAATVSKWINLDDGFVLGFMLGLGSMAFFGKVIETWQGFNLGGLARDFIRKTAGLPPAPQTAPAPLNKD